MRKACAEDEALLLSWANDPETRANSFNSGQISADVHHAWFSSRLADENCDILIFCEESQGGIPVGQVRLEYAEERSGEGRKEITSDDSGGVAGWISYSIDKAFRGRGYGMEILRRAIEYARRERPEITAFVGEVKPGNEASIRIFRRLGFREAGSDGRCETFCLNR